MSRSCRAGKQPCSSTYLNFTINLPKFGNCFVFSPLEGTAKAKAGRDEGLDIKIYLAFEEAVLNEASEREGIRMALHPTKVKMLELRKKTDQRL